MPRVQSHVLMHCILRVTDNGFRIDARVCRQLNAFIARWHRREKHGLHAVSMQQDHLHVLAQLRPSIAVVAYVRKLKTALARWINRRHPKDRRFLWEHEWKAFSIASSQRERECTVIFSQPRVHTRRDAHAEIAILERRSRLLR